jgi:hypothetical protein
MCIQFIYDNGGERPFKVYLYLATPTANSIDDFVTVYNSEPGWATLGVPTVKSLALKGVAVVK